MGLLRILLILAIVIGHTYPVHGFRMCGGAIAVDVFFILSGFYTYLILNEKYIGANKSYKLYITNRMLRIYPTYYLIILMSIFTAHIYYKSTGRGFSLILPYINYWSSLDMSSVVIIILTNLTIVGQEILNYMSLDHSMGTFYLTPCFWKNGEPFLWSFILIPQAWAISLMMIFYLIAPLLKDLSIRKMILIILGSLVVRAVIYALDLCEDPWQRKFFPAELVFFIMGGVSYRILCIVREKYKSMSVVNAICFLAVIIITLAYQYFPDLMIGYFSLRQWGYYLFITMLIPFVFMYTKDQKIDKILPEISFIVYLNHFLILHLVLNYFAFLCGMYDLQIPRRNLESWLAILVLCCSLLLAVIIFKYFQQPIEKIRRSRMAN
jgi:peptidoglycan/LPS O-acetylase OafA/YrhL